MLSFVVGHILQEFKTSVSDQIQKEPTKLPPPPQRKTPVKTTFRDPLSLLFLRPCLEVFAAPVGGKFAGRRRRRSVGIVCSVVGRRSDADLSGQMQEKDE